MKFSSDKKQAILSYILEKISEGTESLSKCVAETFDISQNTVHTYLKELQDGGMIEKGGRGKYNLVTCDEQYSFRRSEGHLDSDTYAYDVSLRKNTESLPENIRQIWSYAFSEMVNNVMDHSGAENMQVLIRRNYLRTDVLIIDDGVGIFEKIRNHFSLSSLDAAICELFKGKLTTDAENHSGEGIFFTSKMMDQFLIFSGGKIFTTTKYDNDQIFSVGTELSGTCVFMSLSNFSHKSAGEVFDLYSNADGGFTKTYIPLKNIFDSAPVSRSQAKRVCYRLDEFREVVFDFEGISWMGQGFAHQVFVVYQKAHPEIALLPENMNESVTNMYQHVMRSV